MRLLRIVPENTRFDFMGWRRLAFGFTLALSLLSVASLAVRGLNLGLDFQGGVLVEARAVAPIDLGELRARIATQRPGEFSLQTFGGDRDVLIRVHQPPKDSASTGRAVESIRTALGTGFEIRRTDFIGPQVSHDLLINGVTASVLAVALIAVYVWFRFEWQFGVAALLTTLHDVVATFGLFSVLGLEFDLTVVAAILTVAGYSINDTVVVFDRVRENLRRYKTAELSEIVNLSVNQTLSRTVLTSGTTMLAVLSLLTMGGPVLRNFSAALAWGIVIGTYSSIFVASSLLLSMPPVREMFSEESQGEGEAMTAAPGDRPQGRGRKVRRAS